MQDRFITYFGWFTDMLNRPQTNFFKPGSQEHTIIARLQDEWGSRDTAKLLTELSQTYGDEAGETVEEYLRVNMRKDWAQIGKQEAHEGTEIEDFVRVLWGPLKEMGFEYTMTKTDLSTKFHVTKCPLHELAKETGMHKWLYHLACSIDPHTSEGFSPKICFHRTKTLMQNDECCDHEYLYR